LIYVFPSGNQGSANSTDPSTGSDAGSGGLPDTVESPGTAKNVITVGAVEQFRSVTNQTIICDPIFGCVTNQPWLPSTDSSNQVASFSSRGNVGIGIEGVFGRFKPDVVAPGTFVVSDRSGQWDQGAYYNATNFSIDAAQQLPLAAFSSYTSIIFVPNNAVQLIVNATAVTPLVPLPITVSAGGADVTGNNQVAIPPNGSLTPVDTFWTFTITNSNPQTVIFNWQTILVTTNEQGDFFTVLKDLNDALGGSYRYESGTSLAAGEVSGVTALMEEFFAVRSHLTNSPAMMKALLINGARTLGDPYDFQVRNNINYQGWGQVSLPTALPGVLSNATSTVGGSSSIFLFDQDPNKALATGESHTRFFTVSPEGQNQALRVTLAWTDPPGNPAASIKLVNDVDLVVTNLDNGDVFLGNDIQAGNQFNSSWDTNRVQLLDVVNNVENVYLKQPLAANYSVTVVGRRVNVNAVTANPNNVAQDYALVVSSGEGAIPNPLTWKTDAPNVTVTTPNVTIVTNMFPNDPENPISGGLLLHQRAGANTPLLGTNTVPLVNGANGRITSGMTNQWHFYVLSNLFNFTNVSFVTFMPPEQAVPRMGVTNVDDPINATRVEADVDMYVSTDPGLTNLSPTSLQGAFKSLSRGGTEVIVRDDAAPGSVYYVGIKSEDHQAGEYSFLGVFSLLPPTSSDEKGNVYLRGVPVPAAIPPGIPPRPQAAMVLGIDVKSIQVRRVIVTNTFTHSLPGSLLGNLSHNTKFVVLNNHTCAQDPAGNCYTNRHDYIYEDNGEHNVTGSRPSDGPGNLKDFIGEEGLGVWLLSMVNTFPAGTGEVDRLTIKLEPQQINTNGTVVDLLPNSWFYDSIDVPGDATNLTVCVTGNTAPLDLYISRTAPPTQSSFDLHLRVNPPGGCLPLTVFDVPPLSAGRYYVGVFNNTFITQHIRVTATIFRNPFAIASSITGNGTTVPIKDDAVSYAYLTNLTDLPISSLDVGLLIRDPRISDLAITLISPKGTRVLLFENRGATSTSGLGTFSTSTNSFGAPTFTSTNLAAFYTNDFDSVVTGPYAPGTIFDGWTVLKDRVTIYPEMPAPWLGNNVAILSSGIISNNLPTTNSTSYVLSFEAAHAPYLVGTVGWWPMDGDASDIFGGFNGLLLGNVQFTPLGKVNQAFLGDGIGARMIVPRAPRLDLGRGDGFSIEGWVSPFNLLGTAGSIVLSDGFEFATPAFQIPAGSTVSGWHVDSGQIDILSSQFPSLFGNPDSGIKCADLNGFVPGTISRSFPTIAGSTYVLSFAYTKNPTTGDPLFVANATVSLSGQTDVPLSYALPNSINNPGWIHTSIVFTASSPTTKLSFSSTTPGKSGMWLDTVQVQQTNTSLAAIPIVEWDDPSSSSPQGVQFFISPVGSTNNLSFLVANLWDTNLQPHLVSTPSGAITNADWQHVALTFDRASSTARLYVNGALQTAQPIAVTNFVPRTSGDIYFGYHPASGINFLGLNGGLDEIGLYDRALTDCEIAAIFKAGSGGKYSTNALGCPVSGTVQLLTSLGPISASFTNGPTWGTNIIPFLTLPSVVTTNGAGPNATPITVTSFDPNLAVDHFLLSSIMTNSIDGLMHLSDNTNLASIPVKFAPAPYSVLNFPPILIFSNEFENAAAGLYAPGSKFPGSVSSPTIGARPWTVVNGPVTVLNNGLVAAVGTNSVALGSGGVQCALPTTPGSRYRLAYSVRGPGMVGWWNGDIEPLSRRAWDLIGGNHGALIDGATNSSAGYVNFHQDTHALSFPGVIDAQNNLVSKIELGDPVNLRLTNSFTIEGWIKPSPVADFTLEQTEQIFFRGDSRQCFDPYYLGIERVTADTMDIVFHVEDDKVGDCGVILESANQPVRVGQWQHIAAVFEGNVLWQTNAPWPTNELRLYVNGKQLTLQNNEVYLEAPSGVTIVNTSFTDRFPFGDLDPSFSPGVAIGNRSRGENSEPYHGLIDELSVYGRALTGPEIAAIAAAGVNGKADQAMPPSQGLAKVAVSVNNVQIDSGWGDNSDWTVHSVDFTADRTNLVLTLQSLLPGTIVDGISLTELPSELHYLPEESLAKLNGEDAAGVWTLEIWDNRVGANVPIDLATLVDWQLNFVLQPSNPPPVVHLQHGIVYTNTIAAGGIQNLVVDVPLWASNATNLLLAATDRALVNPLPVGVLWDLFDQSPTASGQAIVWPPNPTGSKVLFTTAAPNIVPGQPYYVAITNPNPVAATFAYGVWFDVPTLNNCLPSSNFVAQAGIPRYFQFDVPANASGAPLQTVSFYLTGVPNNFVGINSNVTVVLSERLPLPDLSQHDYISSQPNTNDDIIMLVTNSTPFPIQTNRWYVGVFNQADSSVPLSVQACVSTAYPTIVPLTNDIPFGAGPASAFAAPPGPPRQFFFQFQVTNEVDSILFEMYNLSGDADLVVQRDLPPTMAPYYGESFRDGTNWEQVVARVSPEVPSLQGNWYVGIYNNQTANLGYTLRATISSNGILQSIQEPPVPSVLALPAGKGVLISWYSIEGEYYQVQSSLPNPVNWQPVPGGLIHATTPLTTFIVQGAAGNLDIYRIVHLSPRNLPTAPLQIQLWTNNQVRISWSITYPNAILQYANSPFGPWFDANLPATLVGAEYIVFDNIREAPRYYRLLQ
jgi:subtilisin-like proprotein convertase family protein